MKKILSIVLAVVLITMLCGCINISISTNSSSSNNSSQNNAVEEVSTDAENSQGASEINGYTVVCCEEDGQTPISGVTVQLCTDKQCMQKVTNNNGEAFFDVQAGEWEVHIDEVPDGYSKPEDAFTTSSTDSVLVVTISAA